MRPTMRRETSAETKALRDISTNTHSSTRSIFFQKNICAESPNKWTIRSFYLPKKIMRRGLALKPFKDWQHKKEWSGKFTWTIALYGTPAMAKEAGLSEKEYWSQIIKACFLDEKNPIAKWKAVYRQIETYRRKLNALAPKTDRLHAVGPDMDLSIKLGEKRNWLAGSGRNIPSFEIFTSPDWRGTNGWIRFNQPLYRYSNKITGIELWFKNGLVVKSKAK